MKACRVYERNALTQGLPEMQLTTSHLGALDIPVLSCALPGQGLECTDVSVKQNLSQRFITLGALRWPGEGWETM